MGGTGQSTWPALRLSSGEEPGVWAGLRRPLLVGIMLFPSHLPLPVCGSPRGGASFWSNGRLQRRQHPAPAAPQGGGSGRPECICVPQRLRNRPQSRKRAGLPCSSQRDDRSRPTLCSPLGAARPRAVTSSEILVPTACMPPSRPFPAWTPPPPHPLQHCLPLSSCDCLPWGHTRLRWHATRAWLFPPSSRLPSVAGLLSPAWCPESMKNRLIYPHFPHGSSTGTEEPLRSSLWGEERPPRGSR